MPHELNGPVSLRREPKKAVDAFRPALNDVAPIAVVDRYTYTEGENIPVRVFVSNWSAGDLRLTFGDATSSSYAIHLYEPRSDAAVTNGDDGEPVPTTWGPTPVIFTTQPLAGLPANHVLTHEVFDCFPRTFLPGVRGALQIFIPPPIAKWGALVTAAACTLPDTPFARAVAADAR